MSEGTKMPLLSNAAGYDPVDPEGQTGIRGEVQKQQRYRRKWCTAAILSVVAVSLLSAVAVVTLLVIRRNGSEGSGWWEKKAVYQIYPRSYKDSNGDGIGDLNGIASTLDYIKSLGVAALWLSPIFPSPMKDFGYDIKDYTDIAPEYGTLEDFDRLMDETHQRDMKVILDLVPNHTSDEHPWFTASKADKTNKYADWFVWRDPLPDGSVPNNWMSEFGGSSWTLVPERNQYYYHKFLKEQPDLNYRNPAVREAVYDVMRFWLAKGVDGFRVDALPHLLECADFEDEPLNPDYKPGDQDKDKTIKTCTANVDGIHDIVKEMRAVMDEFTGQRLFIAETFVDIDQLVKYYGNGHDEAQMPYNFHLIQVGFDVPSISALVKEYYAKIPSGVMGNWVLGNHDQHRVATRVGQERARLANMLLMTLRGTPTTYYGEEIGMHNADIPDDRVRDPAALRQPKPLWKTVGRDPERTPMQWSDEKMAGFTSADDAWLPVAADYAQRNVRLQESDANSDLSFYRALVKVRNNHAALQDGDFELVLATDDVMVYRRSSVDQSYLVALNFSTTKGATVDATIKNAKQAVAKGNVVVGTDLGRVSKSVSTDTITLAPAEGILVLLE